MYNYEQVTFTRFNGIFLGHYLFGAGIDISHYFLYH